MRERVFILYHPEAPALERATKEAQAYLNMRKHFESMLLLIWLGQPFPPPSAEVRAAFSAAFAAGPKLEAAAWIIDNQRSLGTSIVRSMSTQMFPRATEVSVFRDPFEAAHWLASKCDGDAELILDGLDTLDRTQPA